MIKKQKPIPTPCLCGRLPVVAKARGRGWIVACAAGDNCTNNRTSGWWPKEAEAVEHWNGVIMDELERKAKK